ncbi:MAG: inositol monophosphatase family protein [Anaerolineales bacterium]
MQDRLQLAIELARRAGGLLLEAPTLRISKKGATDLVTDYDLKSEQMLVKGILEAYPEDGILAEEGTNSQGIPAEVEHLWLIDPVDGTTNYAHGVPFYSVSIGLMANERLVFGVVYDPSRDELFHASEGGGAWLNEQPLQVSETRTLEDSLLVTGFPYDIRTNPDNNLDHYSEFALRSRAVRRLGSAALELAYVAAGRFEGYWELRLNPWDWAAGVLMVREAGGVVTTFSGDDKVLDGDETLLATNGRIHQEMMTTLGRI